ncbi:MAG: hypothetical protein IT315_11195, partial [Anaerolineales bacterium]|nr:hypothetical protein [Anaerolineales bacterium]
PIEAEYNMDGPAMRSVWHYSVNGATKVQASLTPPPISDDYSISPDGNWILYSYYFYPGKTDETVTPGLYLGNLREGGTLLYSPDIVVPMWSTDNIHFVYDGLFLGAVDSLPTSIGDGGFLGWVDTNHYLYRVEGMFAMGAVGGEPRTFSVTVPGSAIGGGASSFTFIFVNR